MCPGPRDIKKNAGKGLTKITVTVQPHPLPRGRRRHLAHLAPSVSWPMEGLIFLSFSSHQIVVYCLELAGSWCQLHQLWLWDPPSPASGKSTSLSSPAFQIVSASQDSPNSQVRLMKKVCSSLMAFMVIVLKKALCTKTSRYLVLFDPQNKRLDMDKY